MTAPQKGGSKWGSYFQQAVAGVESRLDNLLAEGIEGEQAAAPAKSLSPPPVNKAEGDCDRRILVAENLLMQ